MTVKVTTPTTIKAMNANIKKVGDSKDRLNAGLKRLLDAYENREALKQKAWEDGVPGSQEFAFGPVTDIEEEAKFLGQLADGILEYARQLRSESVDEWGSR